MFIKTKIPKLNMKCFSKLKDELQIILYELFNIAVRISNNENIFIKFELKENEIFIEFNLGNIKENAIPINRVLVYCVQNENYNISEINQSEYYLSCKENENKSVEFQIINKYPLTASTKLKTNNSSLYLITSLADRFHLNYSGDGHNKFLVSKKIMKANYESNDISS